MTSEAGFQKWYAGHAAKLGLDPNPDAPQHHYDYRAAFRAGAKPDVSGHWPSAHKRAGHPRLVIGGVDTRTGQPARKRMKPGTVARVKARMAADEKRKKEESAKKQAYREYEARLRERAAARKPPAQLTPAQIRSQEAAERRKSWMPAGLRRLLEALGG